MLSRTRVPAWAVTHVVWCHEQMFRTDVDVIGVRAEFQILDETVDPVQVLRDVKAFQSTGHFDRQVLIEAHLDLVLDQIDFDIFDDDIRRDAVVRRFGELTKVNV